MTTRLEFYKTGDRISNKADIKYIQQNVDVLAELPERVVHELYRVFCYGWYGEMWIKPNMDTLEDFTEWLLEDVDKNPKWW